MGGCTPSRRVLVVGVDQGCRASLAEGPSGESTHDARTLRLMRARRRPDMVGVDGECPLLRDAVGATREPSSSGQPPRERHGCSAKGESIVGDARGIGGRATNLQPGRNSCVSDRPRYLKVRPAENLHEELAVAGAPTERSLGARCWPQVFPAMLRRRRSSGRSPVSEGVQDMQTGAARSGLRQQEGPPGVNAVSA